MEPTSLVERNAHALRILLAWPMVRISQAIRGEPPVPIGRVLFGDEWKNKRKGSGHE
jgi:hypothetical protein